ncbi:cobalt-precorrin-6A reductase [Cryptosporangium arvum]|uniref:Precorrin-6x reductase n=1 Tax=Cryptosporangium arvum DSM 44712 TaxID=927661 RepID=A0A010YHN9_9ACTN|nr:cobalt-precorrin-6A reductase [Cryptosporangium arvum]EXG79770.1 precorrin-6x reductase [Cryptosporangium arvum DSM 44712]
MSRVLILGGTGDARRLASLLIGGHDVVSSLAGRVRSPLLPPGEVRIGGFGGVDGLAAYLPGFDAVIDATHPFAARMTAHAVEACARVGVPLAVLRRPGWDEEPGDRWVRVPSVADAAEALSPGQRVFLTTGVRGLDAFAGGDQWFLIRCVDPPSVPLPPRSSVLLARGPFAYADELALLREHSIDVVVTKDSGGRATYPKLEAARTLGLPVVMITRPVLPPSASTVGTPEAAARWLESQAG